MCANYIDARRLPLLGKEVESEVSGSYVIEGGGFMQGFARGQVLFVVRIRLFFISLCW